MNNNNIYNEQPSTNISNSINTNTNSKVYNKEQVNTKAPVDNNYKYKSESSVPKKTILFLSLSAINTLMIVPFIIQFSFVWLIFGAFSGSESLYYGVLIGGAIYVVLSVIILLKEVFTALKYTSKKTNTFILMVIASIFGLILFNQILPYAISKIMINGYDTDFKKEIINSNFATVGDYWVKPNDSSDNYNVYIKYDELKKHNISFSDIKKLSFDLLIYYDDENGKLSDSIQIPYNNFSVEVK